MLEVCAHTSICVARVLCVFCCVGENKNAFAMPTNRLPVTPTLGPSCSSLKPRFFSVGARLDFATRRLSIAPVFLLLFPVPYATAQAQRDRG